MRFLFFVTILLGVIWAEEKIKPAENNDSDLTTVDSSTKTLPTTATVNGLVDDKEILSRILSDPKKRKKLNDLNAEYNLKLMTMIRDFREKEFGVVMMDKLALSTTTAATKQPNVEENPKVKEGANEEEEEDKEEEEGTIPEIFASDESNDESAVSDENEENSPENNDFPPIGFSIDKSKVTPLQRKQRAIKKRKALQRLKAKLRKMSPAERRKWRQTQKKKERKTTQQKQVQKKAQNKPFHKSTDDEKKVDPLKDFFDNAKKNWDKIFQPITTKAPEIKNLEEKEKKGNEKLKIA